MKKLFLIAVLCLLTGCASTSALNQTNAKLEENIKRIDGNFIIIKNVLDANVKAITALGPDSPERESDLKAAIAESKKNPDSGSAIGVLGKGIEK